jgi:Sec-independent protein secretion pathway component TatC
MIKLFKTIPVKYFIYTNFIEKIITNIYISIFLSILILIPNCLLQFFFLIKDGLSKNENYFFFQIFSFFYISNSLLIYFSLKHILPFIWIFFTENTIINIYIFNIYFEPNIKDFFFFLFSSFNYIYIIYIYLYTLMYILIKKLITLKQLINLRNFFFIKFILISILISPPDFGSQFFLFFILVLFFESFIFFFLIFEKYKC